MFKTVLVTLDGSALAERALAPAVAVARATGGRLVLMRAAWAPALGTDRLERETRAVGDAEAYLKAVAERLPTLGDGPVDLAVPFDTPADGILVEAEVRRADLIVMATHGRSGIGRLAFGSVTEAVAARSPVPVLVVRATAEAVPEPLARGLRILVPLDGSDVAAAVLPRATELARAFGGSLALLRVLHGVEPALVPGAAAEFAGTIHWEAAARDAGDDRAEADAYLDAMVSRARAGGIEAEPAVAIGDAAAAIVEAAGDDRVGLIAMATHGRTGLARLALGSVAMAVLARANVPVLLTRPAETVPVPAPANTAPATG